MPSKKKCPEGDIGTYRREGGKKNPLFLLHQKGDISLWREGSKYFCPMSHVHSCVSISTPFSIDNDQTIIDIVVLDK